MRQALGQGVRSLLLFLALVFLSAKHLSAQELDPAALSSQIEEESKNLLALREKRGALVTEIKQKEKELATFTAQKKTVIHQIDVVTDEIKKSESKLKEATKLQAEKELLARKRLIAMYQLSKKDNGALAAAINQQPTAKLLKYTKAVSEYDRKVIEDLERAQEQLVKAKNDNQQALSEQKSLNDELIKKVAAINGGMQSKKDLLATLEVAVKDSRDILDSLKEKAAALEEAVVGIASNAKAPEPQPESERKEQEPALNGIPARISMPVSSATVLSGFGRRQVSGFSDYLLQKGIEFKTPADSEVKAVANGIVRFVGTMPAYGLLTILDHGARTYSLYGKLNAVLFKVGDTVKKGQTVARTGSQNEDAANFYFEIRKDGKAVNPQNYLQNPQKK
jgi:septal ring factor EnvC (AmiA/AmiB activator)